MSLKQRTVLSPRRRAAAAPQPDGWRAPGWVVALLGLAALVLAPWVVVLIVTLPSAHRAAHWNIAWAGFDIAQALLLLTVAGAAWKRSPWLEGAATATATLLLVDAWFDVLTSSTGGRTPCRDRRSGIRRAAARRPLSAPRPLRRAPLALAAAQPSGIYSAALAASARAAADRAGRRRGSAQRLTLAALLRNRLPWAPRPQPRPHQLAVQPPAVACCRARRAPPSSRCRSGARLCRVSCVVQPS